MGLFDSIFGQKPKRDDERIQGYYQALTAYSPVFYSHSGGLYEMDQTRAAINAIATHCSKLTPQVMGSKAQEYARMLSIKPNPWMNTQQFLYRVATILAVENTAFIVPMYSRTYSGGEAIIGIYPVLPAEARVVQATNGKPYLSFRCWSGERAAVEYSKVGVLTTMQYKDDFFGETNRALAPTMDLISIQNQGIEEGIKNAASVRFLARLGQTVRPDDLAKEQDNFRKNNLTVANNGGVLMFDAKYADVKQIDSKPYVVDAEQMKIINDNVYNYFGVNQKILRNEWDEETWNAFYEGKVEPFALQMSLALTSMLFKDGELSHGNRVILSANRLQFATTTNKVNVITNLFDRGLLSFNEAREILQMPPIEGGDQFMIRGEYVSTADRATELEVPNE